MFWEADDAEFLLLFDEPLLGQSKAARKSFVDCGGDEETLTADLWLPLFKFSKKFVRSLELPVPPARKGLLLEEEEDEEDEVAELGVELLESCSTNPCTIPFPKVAIKLAGLSSSKEFGGWDESPKLLIFLPFWDVGEQYRVGLNCVGGDGMIINNCRHVKSATRVFKFMRKNRKKQNKIHTDFELERWKISKKNKIFYVLNFFSR